MNKLKIAGLYRYPVKSMQGETLTETYLGAQGIPLDRGWAIRNENTGNIQGAKQFGSLMQCSARYLKGSTAGLVPHVAITFPDKTIINSDDSRVNSKLSELLDVSVTLWPLQPRENLEHYQRKDTGVDMLEEWRKQIGLNPEDPSPDFSDMPEKVLKDLYENAVPLGTYFDAFPISLLSCASMRKLAGIVPDAKIGAERFRPNILVEDSEDLADHIEFEWIDKHVEIGDAQLSVQAKATRCIMIAREQPGYPLEKQIIRALFKETGMKLSVYADVTKAGRVSVGDTLKIV